MDMNTAQKPAASPAPAAKKKVVSVEDKKKELADRKKVIAAQLKSKRDALKKLEKAEKELLNPKQSRKDRTRALCLLAGMLLEDLKKNKDVAKMEAYKTRLKSESDKAKFAFLIKEVSGLK